MDLLQIFAHFKKRLQKVVQNIDQYIQSHRRSVLIKRNIETKKTTNKTVNNKTSQFKPQCKLMTTMKLLR